MVRPFEWGAEFITGRPNGEDPREAVFEAARRAVAHSEEFYALEPVKDYKLDGDLLTWTSAVRTPSPENNTACARFFPAQPPKSTRRRRDARSSSSRSGTPTSGATSRSAACSHV